MRTSKFKKPIFFLKIQKSTTKNNKNGFEKSSDSLPGFYFYLLFFLHPP